MPQKNLCPIRYIYRCMDIHILKKIHLHILTHTYIYTYIHVHIYTYIGINDSMPHKILCPTSVEEFDNLTLKYVKNPADLKELISR